MKSKIQGSFNLTFHYDVFHMPRPSARTKYFLSRTIFKLSRTKILSRVKKSIFWFPKLFKMSICRWKWFFDTLPIRKFHFELILKEKMEFLTLDKNFVWDNFRFVQDKKYFVRADGRGVIHNLRRQKRGR